MAKARTRRCAVCGAEFTQRCNSHKYCCKECARVAKAALERLRRRGGCRAGGYDCLSCPLPRCVKEAKASEG